MKKVTAIISTLVFLLTFVACHSDPDNETTTTTPEQPAAVDTKEDNDPLLLTLFRYPDSDEYKAIQNADKIETGMNGELNETWKFRAEKDGIKVRLESIKWIPEVMNFQVMGDAFAIETKKGSYYEFSCPVAEAIPEYRLVAEYGKLRVAYTVQQDGAGEPKVIAMNGETFKPEEITEDSMFYALCLSHAITATESDNKTAYEDDFIFWKTFSFAVTHNYEVAGGDAFDGEKLKVTNWVGNAYLSALYPSCNGSYRDFPSEDLVLIKNNQYVIMPCSYGDYHSWEFYGVEDNGNGTYSVKIKVFTYPSGEERLEDSKAVIVQPLDTYNADNPFGYTVLRVEDCDLSAG